MVRCSSYVDNTESVELEILSITDNLKFKCILPSKPNGMSLPKKTHKKISTRGRKLPKAPASSHLLQPLAPAKRQCGDSFGQSSSAMEERPCSRSQGDPCFDPTDSGDTPKKKQPKMT